MGDVRCNRIVHFRSKEPNKKHPVLPGYLNVNVTSGSSHWSPLSPMKLGPFQVIESKIVTKDYPDGIHPGFAEYDDQQQIVTCQCFENYWQFSKIYDLDLIDPKADIKLSNLKASFFQRRAAGFKDLQGHRRALPKKAGRIVASYLDGHIWDYLQSRYYYCVTYETLVRNIPEYTELERLTANGSSVQILGYDGRDIPITVESMQKGYHNPEFPFGHELVICCMLKEIRPWLQDQQISNDS
jgi:hypothetical protein